MRNRRRFLVGAGLVILGLVTVLILGSGNAGDVTGAITADDGAEENPSVIGFEYDPEDDRYETHPPNGTEVCIGNGC